MRTTLTVTGLQTYGYHGLFAEERVLGQKFIFDVCAQLMPATTHLTDRLDTSIRYDDLVREIVRISAESTFHTLEALGETIARRLLQRHTNIRSIKVSVAKLSPPIPQVIEQVRVEVELDDEEVRRGLVQQSGVQQSERTTVG